jgi:hypothetical protein
VPVTRVWKYPIQSSTIFSLQLDRDITIPTDFVMPIIDPENRVGLPSPDSHNIFSNLCLADFDINVKLLSVEEIFNSAS